MDAKDDRVTAGDALAVVGKADPSALKLVGDLMERNSRDAMWALEQAYKGEQAAHARTQAKLDDVTARLRLIEFRIGWLLGDHDDTWGAGA